MAQVSLYIDDVRLDELRKEASSEGVSLSKFVLSAVENRSARNTWPEGWFELFGSIPGFPSVEELREGIDESLDEPSRWEMQA